MLQQNRTSQAGRGLGGEGREETLWCTVCKLGIQQLFWHSICFKRFVSGSVMYFSLCILWIYYNCPWQLLIQLNEHIIKNPLTSPCCKIHLFAECGSETIRTCKWNLCEAGSRALDIQPGLHLQQGDKRAPAPCLWWPCFLCFSQIPILNKNEKGNKWSRV